jgi:type I restriction enzyme R subunit
MSEYHNIERPFLTQLQALGWQIIDQGAGVPTDPAISRRTHFRQTILPELFRQSVRAINLGPVGRPWLSDRQLTMLYDELAALPGNLIEVNEQAQDLLYKHTVDLNERTGEEYPTVKLVDFEHPQRNSFLAVNQFRINTPGCVRPFIIPDIVLFVNGLPLVVVECKEANSYTTNPLYEGYTQIRRYSGQREETAAAGLREGEPALFHFNQFNIITAGDEARFGSITATEEYYYPWRDIYPAEYRDYTPPLGVAREQEELIQGMLPPATLLDIVRNFIVFSEANGRRIKLVCRYQQYRAAHKLIDRLRTGETAAGRSGVVWHTQGSGKSLTMVFTVRKMRRLQDLKRYKIILVNDRRDLEKQLSETAALTEETPNVIDHTRELDQLATPASNLNLVMVHKFSEYTDPDELPEFLQEALPRVPNHETFETISNSSDILLMIDEAHRSQGGLLSENLFDAFPNAARVAFTGTPLVSSQAATKGLLTRQRFGSYIDIYTLYDSVRDNATVPIKYLGRTVHAAIDDESAFEAQFEDLCRPLSDKEVNALKIRYGTTGDILEAEQRIGAIARDLVDHYVEEILPEGFKAQVVASSQLAAIRYRNAIEEALAGRIAVERTRPQPDLDLIAKLEFLKARAIVSGQGTNEIAEITVARRQARDDRAVDNFKKSFKIGDPATGKPAEPHRHRLPRRLRHAAHRLRRAHRAGDVHRQEAARAQPAAGHRPRQPGGARQAARLHRRLHRPRQSPAIAFAIYAEEARQDVVDSLEEHRAELPILEERYRPASTRSRPAVLATSMPRPASATKTTPWYSPASAKK